MSEQKPEGVDFALNAGLDAARGLLHAAQCGATISFALAKNAWDESGPHHGEVADAVQELRAAWYHDGTPAEREKCRSAIAGLQRALASNDSLSRGPSGTSA